MLERAEEVASEPQYKQSSRKSNFLCHLFLYIFGLDNGQSVHSSKQNYAIKKIQLFAFWWEDLDFLSLETASEVKSLPTKIIKN